MIQYTLNIGDVAISNRKATYTCFGLGSCIGLFLQDRLTGLTGGAHIFLPGEETGPLDNNKFFNASAALNELLSQFKICGSNLTCLRAKIVGGANVIGGNSAIGERNTVSVMRQLIANKIYIAAQDVGGIYCRTATFQSDTGQLTVKISQTNEFKIY